jgi:predicted Ser/Thr protein kinase
MSVRFGHCAAWCAEEAFMSASIPQGGKTKTDEPASGGQSSSTQAVSLGVSTRGGKSPVPAAGGSSLPEQFGRYRIVKPLGRGGMGAVYLAHDSQLDRHVALKVPHFTPADGTDVWERFQREARAAATIEHPNICPIYDVGAIDGIPYATMAYLEGRPLSELLKADKRLPQRPVAAVVRKLALAMQAAHANGVIHRDLKPSNVIINKRNEPVIMDFGLARRGEQDPRLTATGAILGTPAYMSPEQARGEPSGQSSDIYSLGVILYELLTGRLPFQGGVPAVLSQILTAHPEPPERHNPEVEPALSAICLKAMAKSAGDRFGSMKELADALGAYLKGTSRPVPAPAAHVASTAVAEPPKSAAALSSAAGGEGLATQLLARLADRLENPPPAPPPEKPRRLQWILAVAGAGVLIAAILGGAAILSSRSQPIDVHTAVAVNVTTVLPDVLDPTVVMLVLDGRNVSREELAGPVSLEPGPHELEIVRRNGTRTSRSFVVSQDSSVELQPGVGRGAKKAATEPAGSQPASGPPPEITWDMASVEELFEIAELEKFDAQRGQISWILVSKEAMDGPRIKAEFYDPKNIQIYDTSLTLTPYQVKSAGVRVRAQLSAPPLQRGASPSPERVVLTLTTRGGGANNVARVLEAAAWDTKALEEHFTILKRTFAPRSNQVEWLLEAKGPTNFVFGRGFGARFIDDEGVQIETVVSLQLQPRNAREAGDKIRATLTVPSALSRTDTKLRQVVVEKQD